MILRLQEFMKVSQFSKVNDAWIENKFIYAFFRANVKACLYGPITFFAHHSQHFGQYFGLHCHFNRQNSTQGKKWKDPWESLLMWNLSLQLSNLFFVSLAVADLLLSTLVMPFAIVNDLSGEWMFGRDYCNMWIATDVMCCTASIISLLAISLERYDTTEANLSTSLVTFFSTFHEQFHVQKVIS